MGQKIEAGDIFQINIGNNPHYLGWIIGTQVEVGPATGCIAAYIFHTTSSTIPSSVEDFQNIKLSHPIITFSNFWKNTTFCTKIEQVHKITPETIGISPLFQHPLNQKIYTIQGEQTYNTDIKNIGEWAVFSENGMIEEIEKIQKNA